MAHFVLVHGAWHGAWCWQRVTPLLEAEGHQVSAVTLTGLAEDSRRLTREVNLSTHVTDVVNLLESQDMQDVVLVGHSYGGLVISGVVRQAKDRLRHLVYLDAILPMPGEDGIEGGISHQLIGLANEGGDGWRIPVPKPSNGQLMGVSDQDDIDWMLENLTDHPLATFQQPVDLDPDELHPVPGTYVICMRPLDGAPGPGNVRNAGRARELDWPVVEINTGHDLMVTEPEQTARILLNNLS